MSFGGSLLHWLPILIFDSAGFIFLLNSAQSLKRPLRFTHSLCFQCKLNIDERICPPPPLYFIYFFAPSQSSSPLSAILFCLFFLHGVYNITTFSVFVFVGRKRTVHCLLCVFVFKNQASKMIRIYKKTLYFIFQGCFYVLFVLAQANSSWL